MFRTRGLLWALGPCSSAHTVGLVTRVNAVFPPGNRGNPGSVSRGFPGIMVPTRLAGFLMQPYFAAFPFSLTLQLMSAYRLSMYPFIPGMDVYIPTPCFRNLKFKINFFFILKSKKLCRFKKCCINTGRIITAPFEVYQLLKLQ